MRRNRSARKTAGGFSSMAQILPATSVLVAFSSSKGREMIKSPLHTMMGRGRAEVMTVSGPNQT